MNGFVLICVRYGRFDNDMTRVFDTLEEAQREMHDQCEDERLRLLASGWPSSCTYDESSAFVDDIHWVIREVSNV